MTNPIRSQIDQSVFTQSSDLVVLQTDEQLRQCVRRRVGSWTEWSDFSLIIAHVYQQLQEQLE